MALFILATALHNLQCNSLLKVCIMIKGGSSVFWTVNEHMLPNALCMFLSVRSRKVWWVVEIPVKNSAVKFDNSRR